jgi:nucleotide-binding universal stress UspA family protein
MFSHLLLCTHGSAGARLAEDLVCADLCAANTVPKVTVLTVVNEDWRHMTGDDWLNTSNVRKTFLAHVDETLAQEIEAEWQRLRDTHAVAAAFQFRKTMGPVAASIATAARALGCDLIVVGPYQKKHTKGLKARMTNKELHPLLPCPLLVAPIRGA